MHAETRRKPAGADDGQPDCGIYCGTRLEAGVADYADGSSQGLWSIGAILLVLFTVLPGHAAFGAAELRATRERRRVQQSPAAGPRR